MRQYIIKRLLAMVPLLLLIALTTFSLVRLQPGDAVMAKLGEAGALRSADRAQIQRELGLDRPAPVQFVSWLGQVITGDLGRSFYTRQPVRNLIMRRLPVSAELVLGSLLIASLIAIPLGVASAYWRNTPLDYAMRAITIAGLSMPDFFFGLVVLILLVSQFGWLPPLNYKPLLRDPFANVQQFMFPILIVGYRYAAITARITRSAMLEVLNQDYVRTARAKGQREFSVVLTHAGRNAIIPVVTVIGTQVTHLFNSLVVIEILFALPGLGSLTYDAVLGRDYPVVQATVLVFAMVALLANLAVDLLYARLDPRIRL